MYICCVCVCVCVWDSAGAQYYQYCYCSQVILCIFVCRNTITSILLLYSVFSLSQLPIISFLLSSSSFLVASCCLALQTLLASNLSCCVYFYGFCDPFLCGIRLPCIIIFKHYQLSACKHSIVSIGFICLFFRAFKES